MIFSKITFWSKWMVWRIIIHGFHLMCSIYYWRKSKKVPPIENPLLFKSAMCLAKEIREGKTKSEEVVQAYIERILEVEPYINAVVQDRFQGALKEAREVDGLVQSGKYSSQQMEEDMPFLGVPFTVKNMIKVKGMKSTVGFELFKDYVADKDSAVVSLMKRAGGIVLLISNSSQFCMLFETTNILHGTTCNPYDTSRTSGGSSGGESALLGAGASLIGLGNDLGGSLRLPANFTGVFAHKSTKGLIPSFDCLPIAPPDLVPMLTSGPMCRYTEDLVLMMKVLTSENAEKLNFGRKMIFKKLKIYYSYGINSPMVAALEKEISAAMQKVVSYFSLTYDVTAKELKLPELDLTNELFMHILVENEPIFMKHITLGKIEHLNVYLEILKSILRKSNFSLKILLMIAMLKSQIICKDLGDSEFNRIYRKLVEDFDNLLDENTVFLYPTFSRTAPYHSELGISLIPSTFYTTIFNILGLPSTAVPLGLNTKGMPIGIQIIGAKNNDPLTVACAVELSEVFGGWIPPE